MRTKSLLFVSTIMMLASFLTACTAIPGRIGASETILGSGNVVTEERDVSGFTAVTLQGMGEVIIDQNGSESLSITTDDNFLPYLETKVSGDTLFIRTTENVTFTDISEMTFRITAAALDSVELSGAGSIQVNNLDTEQWQVTLPGAGSITVLGQTTEQMVELSGAGSYDAENLESQEATIRSSGAGAAVVRVSDRLDVTIDGLGNVEYIGDPVVTQEINGVGNVRQRREAGNTATESQDVRVIWPGPDESVDAQPVLQWETFPGAAQYQVIILESGTSKTIFTETTTETQMPVVSPLPGGVKYTWTVQAQDTQGNVLTEVHSQFLVKALIETVEPANLETVSAMPTLSWKPFNSAASYQVVLLDDDAFPPVVIFDEETTETTIAATTPLEPGSYSWTVWAKDANGVTVAESASQFVVEE